MATEYTITYTYKGQSNTSGKRSVAFNRFTASGDTGRTIGQITSIKYVHWHTSLGSMNWGLRGRLVFGDGTQLVSDLVYEHINNEVVKYTNTFETMPTAEQWATLTSIQTLDTQDKTTSGGYSSTLYWRANSTYPMKVIITFIEEPPVVYAPEVQTFQVTRVNADAVPDDEGVYIATSLKLALGDTAGLNSAAVHVYYAADAYPIVGVSPYIDLTSRIADLMNGLYLNTDLIPGEWPAGSSWYFAVVFIAGEENAVSTSSIARAKGSLHVSGQRGGGVCICGYSKGTTANPLFESYAPAHFYGGIYGVTNYTEGEVNTGGRWIDGKVIFRRVVPVSLSVLDTGSEIAVLPDIDAMISLSGFVTRDNNQRFPVVFWYSSSNYHSIWMSTPTQLMAKTSHAISGWVIIEYTKSEEAN